MQAANGSVREFMATMVAPAQPVEPAHAAQIVREHYGLEVEATRLTGERDENFRIATADGAAYVLKIANPAEAPAITDLPIAALLHIERSDPQLPCPRVVRTRGGAAQVRCADATGTARIAHLITWLPGVTLAGTVRSAAQRAACGRMSGRLALALRGFSHPAALRPTIWDLRHVGEVAHLLAEISGFPHGAEAAALLARVVPPIDAALPRLRQQAVHNDLNTRNVLVAPGDPARITGVIDFGDLAHTAVIADVAVTAADHLPDECGADVAAARAALLDVARAYDEVLPLEEGEWALLGELVAARLAANLVIPEWHRQHNPAGGHFAPLAADFIGTRLGLIGRLLKERLS